MPTIMKTALKYMERTKLKEVKQTDLISHVSKLTGCSKESVRGTIIGYSPRKMFSQPSFSNKWDVCRRQGNRCARFVRKGMHRNEVYKINYDTPSKKKSRERGLKYVTKRPSTYLTLAGTEGLCVKHILRKCPTAIVHNVERYKDILTSLEKHKLPVINHNQTLSEFIQGPVFSSTKFHLLNLDLMGYACDGLNKDIETINNLKNSKFITLTLTGIKRFRNQGKFVEWAKSKFRSDDPTLEWLCCTLNNYELIDSWFYRRDTEDDCRNMRMFVFKRNV